MRKRAKEEAIILCFLLSVSMLGKEDIFHDPGESFGHRNSFRTNRLKINPTQFE